MMMLSNYKELQRDYNANTAINKLKLRIWNQENETHSGVGVISGMEQNGWNRTFR